MARFAGYVTLLEELGFVQVGVEERFHAQVKVFYAPLDEVLNGSSRAVCIENLQSVSLGAHLTGDGLESPRGFQGNQGARLLVAIDAVADEIVRGVVTDLLDDARHVICQHDETRSVVCNHFPVIGLHFSAFLHADSHNEHDSGKSCRFRC